MAVITELIDAGLQLKRQGNLRGAIEHFRQLHATYPANARVMFELARTWSAFNVPEQALPIYRELLAMPKGQGLQAKDLPRLYTYLGATLLKLGETDKALATIDEGMRLHPSYRPLRVWRIFALSKSDADQLALLDALEFLLESLAPSRWDIFEGDIAATVKKMRAEHSAEYGQEPIDTEREAPRQSVANDVSNAADFNDDTDARLDISVSVPEGKEKAADAAEVDVVVNVTEPSKKARKGRRKQKTKGPQLGKNSVRIDISAAGDAAETQSDDDEPATHSSGFKIPVDLD